MWKIWQAAYKNDTEAECDDWSNKSRKRRFFPARWCSFGSLGWDSLLSAS